MPLTAADTASLITDINDANATAFFGSVTIDLTTDITLTSVLPAISLAAGVTLTIDGLNNTLDGAGAFRGIAAVGGTVTLANLTIAHTLAQGVVGGIGGGGGGAGLGGGLFVGAAATVALVGVSFSP